MEKERNERIALIDKSTELLRGLIDNLSLSLILFLTGWFTEKLVLDADGNIEDSKENYQVINQVEEAKASFFTDAIVPFLAGISLVFFNLQNLNKKYFQATEQAELELKKPKIPDRPKAKVDITDCVTGVEDEVRTAFGFNINDDDVEILPAGWLANVGDLKSVYDRIREMAMRAIGARIPLDDFLKSLKIELKGNDEFSGLVQSHFKTIIWDIYAEFDRQVGYKTAVCLGYRAAIYEGGLIDRSRDFCIERDGKVFTFDEIKKFGTPEDQYGGYSDKSTGEFDGKPKIGYEPFFDQGGYNCRHAFSYIPDRLAISLRPELKEVWNA